MWRVGDASKEGVEEPGGGHGFLGEVVRVCKGKFGVLWREGSEMLRCVHQLCFCCIVAAFEPCFAVFGQRPHT